MNRFLIVFLLLVGVFTQQAQAAETAYISSKQAKIYQEANFKSEIVAELKQNDALEVIENKGLWIQVKKGFVTGWVSKYSITTSQPFTKKISIFDRIKSFFRNDSKRDRVSIVSTVGGVRGLSDDESEASGNKDYQSVEEMESLEVSDEEVDNFVKENVN